MGNHHTETILTLLDAWQKIIDLESEAISEGNFQKLETLVHDSTMLMKRLEKLFSSSDPSVRDKRTLEMIKKIFEQHGKNIQVLQSRTDELKQEIGDLRKNQSSLGGYKQNKVSAPRFKSERM
jgi:hypothetical protein